jgi:hypothetical protein
MATANNVPNVHSSIDSSNKTLLKSEALYQYVLDTSVLPHEPECMRELRLVTDKHEQYVSLYFSLDCCVNFSVYISSSIESTTNNRAVSGLIISL